MQPEIKTSIIHYKVSNADQDELFLATTSRFFSENT